MLSNKIKNGDVFDLDAEDAAAERAAKKYVEQLRKIGPHSKQILNYSYPPLLY